ncbi:hypothetical protein BT69DRAFT_1288441 [Atractiella rhizophila]|nr:hypothetical protein BT69DRAFT_1288441 [Atractiella rhizophila]
MSAFGEFLSDIERGEDLSLPMPMRVSNPMARSNSMTAGHLPPQYTSARNGIYPPGAPNDAMSDGNGQSREGREGSGENGKITMELGPLPKHNYAPKDRDEEKYKKQAQELNNWLASRGHSNLSPTFGMSAMPPLQQQQKKRRREDSPPRSAALHAPVASSSTSNDSYQLHATSSSAYSHDQHPSQQHQHQLHLHHPQQAHYQAPQSSYPSSHQQPQQTQQPPAPPQPRTKPPLLTEAQKKANHILSEQKRRLAIKGGYDALCEAVPSLRAQNLNGSANGNGKKDKKKEGAKSEAVVLARTVEYLRELLEEREGLQRHREELWQRGRSAGLSQNVLEGDRSWERKWDTC